MKSSVFILDTFTSTRFQGNPAAVCLLEKETGTKKMQLIAGELNLPVTAFIQKQADSNNYLIRYFTPITEIPACGHATLGSAFIVFGLGNTGPVTFCTIESVFITATQKAGLVTLEYPRYETTAYSVNDDMIESLQIKTFTSAKFCKELETVFIELEDPAVLRNVKPDFQKLLFADPHIKEVVVTSVSDIPQYDFLLRSFCPWIGIDEDPVTGSVHSVLAGFWEQRTGKPELRAWQASERGGEVFIHSYKNKVELGGNCVMVLKGEIIL